MDRRKFVQQEQEESSVRCKHVLNHSHLLSKSGSQVTACLARLLVTETETAPFRTTVGLSFSHPIEATHRFGLVDVLKTTGHGFLKRRVWGSAFLESPALRNLCFQHRRCLVPLLIGRFEVKTLGFQARGSTGLFPHLVPTKDSSTNNID